LISTDWFQEHN